MHSSLLGVWQSIDQEMEDQPTVGSLCHTSIWQCPFSCIILSLQTGFPYGLFRDLLSTSLGSTREERLQWSLYDLSSASFSTWLIFYLASLLDSTKVAMVAIATEKHKQHKLTFRSKNQRIIAWTLNLEWKHLFRTFLTWFRCKNDLGKLETRMKENTEQTAWLAWAHNYSLRVVRHGNWNKACFWIISALKASKWSQITLCVITNILTSISERFCCNFEQKNIPPRLVSNWVWFVWAFESHWFDMCQVKFANQQSEHKYSHRTRTIAGSPLSRPPPSYSKENLGIYHTESLFAGYIILIKATQQNTGQGEPIRHIL